MTILDLLIGMMFKACVIIGSAQLEKDIEMIVYNCPLIYTDAEFRVAYNICSDVERYAIMLVETKTRRGFVLNQFGSLDPAYIDAERSGNGAYSPTCKTK